MAFKLGQKIIDKVRKKDKEITFSYTEDEYKKVLDFFKYHQNFRTLNECAKITGIDIDKCGYLKRVCYDNRDLGMYYFEADAEPHKYMREYILKNTEVNKSSKILEIGPGNCPIFDYGDYVNWYGADKNFDSSDNEINFNGKKWAHNKYPEERIIPLGWENISQAVNFNDNLKNFDLIVSSHSFEHVFTPVKSLIEASKLLKDNGLFIMFVPDGFSDEPAARSDMTHTLYLVPDMIKEFFSYANTYKDLKIEVFRPNYDYVVVARRKYAG